MASILESDPAYRLGKAKELLRQVIDPDRAALAVWDDGYETVVRERITRFLTDEEQHKVRLPGDPTGDDAAVIDYRNAAHDADTEHEAYEYGDDPLTATHWSGFDTREEAAGLR